MVPKYIVIHHNGVPGRTIENIRRTHKAKGWSDVGYHYVILESGLIQRGRPEHKTGAHTRGLNSKSIGICMIGNGNKRGLYMLQRESLCCKLGELQEAYGIPTENVIGHREVNRLVAKKYHTRKLCPGKLLDMDHVRGWLVPAGVA